MSVNRQVVVGNGLLGLRQTLGDRASHARQLNVSKRARRSCWTCSGNVRRHDSPTCSRAGAGDGRQVNTLLRCQFLGQWTGKQATRRRLRRRGLRSNDRRRWLTDGRGSCRRNSSRSSRHRCLFGGRFGRRRRHCLTLRCSEILEGSDVGLVLDDDAQETTERDVFGAGRHYDLGQVPLFRSLKAHRRFVRLDLRQQVTLVQLVSLLLFPGDDGSHFHGRRQSRQRHLRVTGQVRGEAANMAQVKAGDARPGLVLRQALSK